MPDHVFVHDRIVQLLVEAASFSLCQKSKRGALIVSADGQRHLTGSNKPALGVCDGSDECRRDCSKICIHAEERVLLRAAAKFGTHGDVYHLKVVDGKPVPSGPPSCVECSKLMLTSGVAGVHLFQEDGWWRWTAEKFHKATLRKLGLRGGE